MSCTCSQTICRFETFSIFKSTIQVCGIDSLHSLDGLCLGEFCVNGLEDWYCLGPWPLPSTPTNRLPQAVSPRLLVHHIFQVNQRSRANGPTRMAPSEGSQIESSQAKVAKRNFPNDSSKSNEPTRASPRAGCHANAESESFERQFQRKEYQAKCTTLQIPNGISTKDRSGAKGSKRKGRIQRARAKDPSRMTATDRFQTTVTSESSKVKVPKRIFRVKVRKRTLLCAFPGEVSRRSFQATASKRQFERDCFRVEIPTRRF